MKQKIAFVLGLVVALVCFSTQAADPRVLSCQGIQVIKIKNNPSANFSYRILVHGIAAAELMSAITNAVPENKFDKAFSFLSFSNQPYPLIVVDGVSPQGGLKYGNGGPIGFNLMDASDFSGPKVKISVVGGLILNSKSYEIYPVLFEKIFDCLRSDWN